MDTVDTFNLWKNIGGYTRMQDKEKTFAESTGIN